MANGILYLVGTPIGNLEDMTFRGVRILKEVDLIGAEDTRNTRKLLAHYDIHTPLTSYHEHNKFSKGPELIARLSAGENIAIVSDAGLPGIADPGTHLVQLAIAEGIQIMPVPGANAGLSALICSGLDTVQFSFIGFLPKTAKKRKEMLEAVKYRTETLIFYESPHRLKEILKDMGKILEGTRKIALGRELTKKFEEFKRATLAEIAEYYQHNDPKGEFVIILQGFTGEIPDLQENCHKSPVELVEEKMAAGTDKKTAMKEVAKLLNMSRRDIYQQMLAQEKQ